MIHFSLFLPIFLTAVFSVLCASKVSLLLLFTLLLSPPHAIHLCLVVCPALDCSQLWPPDLVFKESLSPSVLVGSLLLMPGLVSKPFSVQPSMWVLT